VNWRSAAYIALVFVGCLFIISLPFMAIFGLAWFPLNFYWLAPSAFILSLLSCYVLASLFVKAEEPKDVPPEVVETLSEVSAKAGLKKLPKLKVVKSPEVNAMAYSSPLAPRVAVTTGLVQRYSSGELSLDEVKAVLAHEVSHVKMHHPLRASIASSIVSVTDVLSSFLMVAGTAFALATLRRSYLMFVLGLASAIFGAVLKVASKIASIISFHYLRSMEYEADVTGASLTGVKPMVSMLEKVEKLNAQLAKPEGKLFMPERWTLPTASRNWIEKLFDTHPPTQKRIERLLKLQSA
jgi:heat shock protein HtpX